MLIRLGGKLERKLSRPRFSEARQRARGVSLARRRPRSESVVRRFRPRESCSLSRSRDPRRHWRYHCQPPDRRARERPRGCHPESSRARSSRWPSRTFYTLWPHPSTSRSDSSVSERLLTTRQVAEFLGVSPETVLRRWRAGELPGYRLASNVLRFRESELEAWLEGTRPERTLVSVRTQEYSP